MGNFESAINKELVPMREECLAITAKGREG